MECLLVTTMIHMMAVIFLPFSIPAHHPCGSDAVRSYMKAGLQCGCTFETFQWVNLVGFPLLPCCCGSQHAHEQFCGTVSYPVKRSCGRQQVQIDVCLQKACSAELVGWLCQRHPRNACMSQSRIIGVHALHSSKKGAKLHSAYTLRAW